MPMVNQTKIPCFQSEYCNEFVSSKRHLGLLKPFTVGDILDGQHTGKDHSGESEDHPDDSIYDCSTCRDSTHELNLDNAPSWSELPSLALERIYFFLDREDQYRMSLVCRRWSNEYKSPALWRTVKLHLKEPRNPRSMYPEVNFAWKNGYLFRHLQVVFHEPAKEESLKNMETQLKFFLQAVASRSRLLSISFVNMCYFSDFRYLNVSSRSGLYEAIVNLFGSQTSLRSIEFHDSYFTKSELEKVLEAAFSNNNRSLRDLKIKVFNCFSALDKSCNREQSLDLSFINSILNLVELEVDYTRFFEIIISGLLRNADEIDSGVSLCKKGKLKRIKLLCDRNVAHHFCFGCLGIPLVAWTCLKKLCPEVEVDLRIATGFFYKEIIQFVIVPGMPLRSLELDLKPYSDERLDFVLEHLIMTGAKDYLEEVSLLWVYRDADLAPGLIGFLQACSRLRVLKISVPQPVYGLAAVFEFLLRNTPRTLEVFNITITHVVNAECMSFYKDIVDYYVDLFLASKVQLSLLADIKLISLPE